jgi:hypothetical protein
VVPHKKEKEKKRKGEGEGEKSGNLQKVVLKSHHLPFLWMRAMGYFPLAPVEAAQSVLCGVLYTKA